MIFPISALLIFPYFVKTRQRLLSFNITHIYFSKLEEQYSDFIEFLALIQKTCEFGPNMGALNLKSLLKMGKPEQKFGEHEQMIICTSKFWLMFFKYLRSQFEKERKMYDLSIKSIQLEMSNLQKKYKLNDCNSNKFLPVFPHCGPAQHIFDQLQYCFCCMQMKSKIRIVLKQFCFFKEIFKFSVNFLLQSLFVDFTLLLFLKQVTNWIAYLRNM